MSTDAPLFPELDRERARLGHARACRDRMIARLEAVDPDGAADEITKEYIEVTVADALDDLRTPGAGDFFGRIDEAPAGSRTTTDVWYVGRRHIEDDHHDPVVVDWRAPIAAPFYRATVADPLGLSFRRRFTLGQVDAGAAGDATDLTAYLDEHLDDPTEADVAAGIPDPVLAEIGAARTGEMREIVATIQAEQDIVIRAPIGQCLVVQGGPGTGKTAVGLHRAAYLLFEHRRRLAREGVLVVGPNKVFLDYIGNVLPSLGERSVRQVTVGDLCVPRVEVTGVDEVEVARLKGDPRLLDVLARAVTLAIDPPKEAVRLPLGARTVVFPADEVAEWIVEILGDGAATGGPINRRRDALRVLAQRELQRRTGNDTSWSSAQALRSALDKAWPSQNPKTLVSRLLSNGDLLAAAASGILSADEQSLLLSRGKGRRRVTPADQLLIDEANSLLNGPPFTYGHVVVDEAQDHSAVALRVIGRRSPNGSLTILGDLAQSTTPAGQSDWAVVQRFLNAEHATVAHLTIGYRVPAPILDIANRLLPLTHVDTVASRSVRVEGEAPRFVRSSEGSLAVAVADAVHEVRVHHPLTGVVAPARLHDAIGEALAATGLRAAAHVQELARDEVPVFAPEAVKGLEFDGTARGARLLYVAMTRAVQVLRFVGTEPLPTPLA